jgi:hypothetical protein
MQPRLVLVLDHASPRASGCAAPDSEGRDTAEPPARVAAGGGAPPDVDHAKPSDMRWLTRSDLEGLLAKKESGRGDAQQQRRRRQMPAIVAEAIRDAAYDIPEVTQAGWMLLVWCGVVRGGVVWCGVGWGGEDCAQVKQRGELLASARTVKISVP